LLDSFFEGEILGYDSLCASWCRHRCTSGDDVITDGVQSEGWTFKWWWSSLSFNFPARPRRAISFITTSLFASISIRSRAVVHSISGDESDKGGIKGGNAVGETHLVFEEPPNHVSGFLPVNFHCTLEYTARCSS
jgi:hypothetical protein